MKNLEANLVQATGTWKDETTDDTKIKWRFTYKSIFFRYKKNRCKKYLGYALSLAQSLQEHVGSQNRARHPHHTPHQPAAGGGESMYKV
jgi:hypothetical protein